MITQFMLLSDETGYRGCLVFRYARESAEYTTTCFVRLSWLFWNQCVAISFKLITTDKSTWFRLPAILVRPYISVKIPLLHQRIFEKQGHFRAFLRLLGIGN